MTDAQFGDLFSVSQITPGTSILIVGMVGHAAGLLVDGVWGGILGGVIASAAMVFPAASLVMSRAADHDRRAYSLTAVCTLIFMRSKVNPLLIVAAAGVIGYLGFV